MRLLFAALLALWPGLVWGQSPPNPPPGSVWTYQGPPTPGPAWVAPLPVTCTTDATKNTTALQAAIDKAAASGGGTAVIVPGTECPINAKLLISTSQTGIVCGGGYGWGISEVTALPTSCTLRWTGVEGGTILEIAAPKSGATAQVLFGNIVRGVNFLGNAGLAANGLVLKSVRQGTFEGNYFAQFSGGVALDLNVVKATTAEFAPTCDSQWNVFTNNTISSHGVTSIGLRLGAYTNPDRVNIGCNASLNTFINTTIGSSTATALLLDGVDNNRFFNTAAVTAMDGGSAVVDISIHVENGIRYPSNNNFFYGLSTSSHGGKIIARGRETFSSCLPYQGLPPSSGTTMADVCTYANTIDGLDVGNGGGYYWPLQETGAQFAYRWGDENYLHSAGIPTVLGCTGLGASPPAICDTEEQSRIEAGWINMLTGPYVTGPEATAGHVEMKLGGYIGQKVVCTTQLMVALGVATWAPGATTIVDVYPINTTATTTAYEYFKLFINWNNNGVVLTPSTWYKIGYTCKGFNYF